MLQKLDIDVEEFLAWLVGKPVAARPQPPPNRTTKKFILTMMSRDVVVIPPGIWPEASNVRSEP